MTIPNYPRPEVKAFGERVNAAMYDASIRHSMGGLGGCRDFRIEDFDEDVRPYILAYLEGDLDSVAITYAAMRTKELEPAQATQAEVTDGIRPEDFTVDVVVKPMGGFAPVNTQGVRVTHKPTGISVTCDVVRSQHANRNQAFEKLCTILSQQPDNAACKSVQKRLAVQQPATSEPVKVVPYNPTTEMMFSMKGLDPALSLNQCRELWAVAWKAAPTNHPAPSTPVTPEPVLDATLTRDLQASAPAPWEASFHKTVTGKPFGIVTGGQPGNGRMDIVICYGPDAYDEPLSFKAFLANAPLIAAAPKLLAALELIANAENSALDLAYCKGVARAAIGASATTSR